jgi:hypothetical protein
MALLYCLNAHIVAWSAWLKIADICHRLQVIKRSKTKNQGGDRQNLSAMTLNLQGP